MKIIFCIALLFSSFINCSFDSWFFLDVYFLGHEERHKQKCPLTFVQAAQIQKCLLSNLHFFNTVDRTVQLVYRGGDAYSDGRNHYLNHYAQEVIEMTPNELDSIVNNSLGQLYREHAPGVWILLAGEDG